MLKLNLDGDIIYAFGDAAAWPIQGLIAGNIDMLEAVE
jgi:hypothetical protein